MISRAKDCPGDGKAAFYSDGNDDYLYVLPEYFEDLELRADSEDTGKR